MTQQRKAEPRRAKRTSDAGTGPDAASVDGARPLSARSVVASTLLGMQPPRLPGRLLVRSGELFGIAEGTTRVALTRMVAAGELELADSHYQLAGPLLDRHARQAASRRPRQGAWKGDWIMAVVVAERREASARASLREAMRRLQLVELRQGVWTRPDNLDADRAPEAQGIVAEQCLLFTGRPRPDETVEANTDRSLAAELWALDDWAQRARQLGAELDAMLPALERGDTASLAPGFVLSAAVLRHLLADPMLPESLLPADWPGPALRGNYDRYDAAFKAVWRTWFRTQA